MAHRVVLPETLPGLSHRGLACRSWPPSASVAKHQLAPEHRKQRLRVSYGCLLYPAKLDHSDLSSETQVRLDQRWILPVCASFALCCCAILARTTPGHCRVVGCSWAIIQAVRFPLHYLHGSLTLFCSWPACRKLKASLNTCCRFFGTWVGRSREPVRALPPADSLRWRWAGEGQRPRGTWCDQIKIFLWTAEERFSRSLLLLLLS